MSIRPILNYFGGKYRIAPWVIENLPQHQIYVEPFGGGAGVLLRKGKSYLEVYNDLDSEIVNVFKMCRNKNKELKDLLKYTPYSREEYVNARLKDNVSDLEKARRTIVKSFMGIGDSIHNKCGFRNSKSSNANPARSFKNYVDSLEAFSERLRDVFIENIDYQSLVEKYDSEETLFYMDPPYLHSTRIGNDSYGHEMKDAEHENLIKILKEIKGNVVLSGYANELYNELKWNKVCKKTRSQKNGKTGVLWIKDVKNELFK